MYEFQQMLARSKSEGYTIIPVMLRWCHYENNPYLSNIQIVGTYKSEYEDTDPFKGKELMPFEDLADIKNPSERSLNKYFIKIVEAIDKAIEG